ncbi:hypothetical protein PFISCL1PPCAC_7205, partial [Pristionchus fissidentatus]
ISILRTMVRLLNVLLTVLLCADAYKILVYSPKFGHSHSNYMGRIADLLTEAGHNVTTIISIIDHTVKDGTKLSNIIRVEPSAETTELYKDMTKTKTDLFTTNNFNPIGAYFMGQFFSKLFAAQCRALLEEAGLVEKLKAEKYDVFFTENFDMCGVGLSHVIKPKSFIPVAASGAFGPQLEEFGLPAAISYNPAFYVSHMNVHSMWDRIVNIYADWLVRLSFNPMRYYVSEMIWKNLLIGYQNSQQISSNSAFVFTNTEPLIDYALPSINKVISIGGIGVKEAKQLSEDWESILTKREKTVLLSFGSVSKSMYLPAAIKASIIETVKALPHVTFIWKYEADDEFTKNIASKVENLHLSKWMPQVNILAHPRMSAFVTHGGMGSTQETASRGVPGIFVPLFGDQPRNAGMMEHNKLGKVSKRIANRSPAKFYLGFRQKRSSKCYLKNAKRVSAMLHKKPFTVIEQIVKYTEFAAEFGPSKALRPQSHDMNWIEHNNLVSTHQNISLCFLI